jgi:hypothetical protein
MNGHRFASLCLCVLALCGCEPPANSPAQPGAGAPPLPPGQPAAVSSSDEAAQTALVAAYRAAHDKKDVEAMLKLYCFDGASDDMRQTIRENVEDELRHPIASASIEPVAPGTHGPTVEGGVHWRPSLEVVALLTAKFDTSKSRPGELATQQVKHSVGKKRGACLFAVPVRE